MTTPAGRPRTAPCARCPWAPRWTVPPAGTLAWTGVVGVGAVATLLPSGLRTLTWVGLLLAAAGLTLRTYRASRPRPAGTALERARRAEEACACPRCLAAAARPGRLVPDPTTLLASAGARLARARWVGPMRRAARPAPGWLVAYAGPGRTELPVHDDDPLGYPARDATWWWARDLLVCCAPTLPGRVCTDAERRTLAWAAATVDVPFTAHPATRLRAELYVQYARTMDAPAALACAAAVDREDERPAATDPDRTVRA